MSEPKVCVVKVGEEGWGRSVVKEKVEKVRGSRVSIVHHNGPYN